jgi:pimeloyl-ACP methyl ester carboxylesterase
MKKILLALISSYAIPWEAYMVDYSAEESMIAASVYDDFGSIPIKIVTSRKETEDNAALTEFWINQQKDFLSLSTQSEQIVIDGVGHYIHIDKPEIVEECIKTMVEQYRETYKKD